MTKEKFCYFELDAQSLSCTATVTKEELGSISSYFLIIKFSTLRALLYFYSNLDV